LIPLLGAGLIKKEKNRKKKRSTTGPQAEHPEGKRKKGEAEERGKEVTQNFGQRR